MINPIKYVKCKLFKHIITTPSIVNTINSNNWIKKCDRCGMYIIHGDIGAIEITKKTALKYKREFEETFPYSIKGENK